MITATRYPVFSRNFDDEQDYADAALSAARKADPLPKGLSLTPILRWNRQRRLQQQQHQEEGSRAPTKIKCKTLVVGFQGGGASFVKKCFGLGDDGSADWIGTVVLPGIPSGIPSMAVGLGDSLDSTDPLNSACNIFLKKRTVVDGSVGSGRDESVSGINGDSRSGAPGESEGPSNTAPAPGNDMGADDDGVVIVLCGYSVPSRHADAWAKALLGGIDAEVVVALTTVAAEPGRSEAWQGARLIATAEAEEREDCLKMSVGFHPLRTPTMLNGASAALVSYCQRHSRAAMCFAAAELPGRRRIAPLLRPSPREQFGGGDGARSSFGGGSTLPAERSLACTRKPLEVVAAGAMVSGDLEGAEEVEIDEVDSATGSLYV